MSIFNYTGNDSAGTLRTYVQLDIESAINVIASSDTVTIPIPSTKCKWVRTGGSSPKSMSTKFYTTEYGPLLMNGSSILTQWSFTTAKVAINTNVNVSWTTGNRVLQTSSLFNSSNKNTRTHQLILKHALKSNTNSSGFILLTPGITSSDSTILSLDGNLVLSTFNITLNENNY